MSDPADPHALLSAGRYAEAEAAADRALAAAPGHPGFLYFKGAAALCLGDAARALAILDEAATRTPPDLTDGRAAVEIARGRALLALERPGDARAAIEAALEIRPSSDEARILLADAHEALGAFSDAAAALEQVAATAPERPFALSRLAELSERAGDDAAADALIEAALALDPHNPAANIGWAQRRLDAGDARAVAEGLVARLEQARWSPDDLMLGWHLVGKARHELGLHAEAMRAHERANAVRLAELAGRPDRAPGDAAAETRALGEALFARGPEFWPRPNPDLGDGPVFLIGFPRSGTTLLDQILSSHPDCAVVEERPANLAAMWRALAGPPNEVSARLEALSSVEADAIRADYRARLADAAASSDARVLIDKYPMLLSWAPVLRWFWPGARFVLVVRDPRDAVLSAFEQPFHDAPGMRAMLRLETAADLFDAAMALFHDLTERVECRVHTVRYEDVVENFDGAIGPLLDFLELAPSVAVRDFQTTARGRLVRTASRRQVVKPLYRSSIGKWRAYEDELAAVRPVLDAWAARLGYSAS